MKRDQLKEGIGAIGFGTGLLDVTVDPRGAANVIAAAYDAGLRYFDTARLYANGLAEGVIGQVLEGRRDNVVITSKAGIIPIDISLWGKAKRKLLGVGREPRFNAFSLEELRTSLDRTLKNLRTDYLDAWLLHEVKFEHVDQSDLIEYLGAEQKAGRIKKYGLATSARESECIARTYPALAEIVQISVEEHDEWLRSSHPGGRLIVLHSIFANRMHRLRDYLHSNGQARTTLTELIGEDCTDPRVVARLLIDFALANNPDGIVLFSSSRPERIVETANRMNGKPAPDEALDVVRKALISSAQD